MDKAGLNLGTVDLNLAPNPLAKLHPSLKSGLLIMFAIMEEVYATVYGIPFILSWPSAVLHKASDKRQQLLLLLITNHYQRLASSAMVKSNS